MEWKVKLKANISTSLPSSLEREMELNIATGHLVKEAKNSSPFIRTLLESLDFKCFVTINHV